MAPLARMAAMMSEVPLGLAAGVAAGATGAGASTAGVTASGAKASETTGAGAGAGASPAGFLRSIAMISAVVGFLSVMMSERHDVRANCSVKSATELTATQRAVRNPDRARRTHETAGGIAHVRELRRHNRRWMEARQLNPGSQREILTLRKPISLEPSSYWVYDGYLIIGQQRSEGAGRLDFSTAGGHHRFQPPRFPSPGLSGFHHASVGHVFYVPVSSDARGPLVSELWTGT